MKKSKIIALLLVAAMLLGFMFSLRAYAEENETCVYFRIVWHKKSIMNATVMVCLQQYEDAEGTIAIGTEISFGVDKYAYPLQSWERDMYLTEGYWRVTFMSPVNEWQTLYLGESEVFYVRPDVECMTVYVGLAPEGESAILPDPWVVYEHDNRDFWIWTHKAEETKDPEEDTSDDVSVTDNDPFKIFDTNTSTDTGNASVIPDTSTTGSESSLKEYNDISSNTTSEQGNKNTKKMSATVGTWITIIVLVSIIVGGAGVLIIKKLQKRS